jgi:nucleoside-diphosphate-sugar epimerase
MRILVVGGGFLAVPIIERLESEGHILLVFSRTFNTRIRCEQVIGDIFNFPEFISVLAWKPQIIIHTAWITKPEIYKSDLSNIDYANFTSNLAKFVAYSEVEHLIILGSCAEYGVQPGPCTAGLTHPNPRTLYAKQKVAAFQKAKELMISGKTRFTWARVFYTYGLNQNNQRLIPYLIDSLRAGKSVQLADSTSTYDWISSTDIASAISWVISHSLPIEIDIGTSVGFTNLELLKTLEELLDVTNAVPLQKAHEIGLNEVFVVGKNSPLLSSGWLPTNTLSQGLKWVLDN